MKGQSTLTLVAAGAAFVAAITSSGAARAEHGYARLTSHVALEPALGLAVDVRTRVIDHERLRRDPITRSRSEFSYLAWLPPAESASNELDVRPVLRVLIGRQLVAENGFNLYLMRGSHLLSADLGSTRIGIAPNGFSLHNGTTVTLAAVF